MQKAHNTIFFYITRVKKNILKVAMKNEEAFYHTRHQLMNIFYILLDVMIKVNIILRKKTHLTPKPQKRKIANAVIII